MVSCDKASTLTSASLDRRLTLGELVGLWMHRAICGPCRAYRKQLLLMRRRARRLGETPAAAMKREILEEINYLPPSIDFFAAFPTPKLVRHVFVASLTVDLDRLELREGWDLGLWTPGQIMAGARYSSRADEVRSLASPHQKILLEFLGG